MTSYWTQIIKYDFDKVSATYSVNLNITIISQSPVLCLPEP